MLQPTYDAVTRLIAGLSPPDLVRPSRCAGWVVGDVLVHLLGDAQRALMACATPTTGPPTVDAAGYFAAWTAATTASAASRGARFTRIQASAYQGVSGLLAQWSDTAGAAARAVAALDPLLCVRTQGQVLTVSELERTLVVEAVVHHLDVLLELAGPPPVGLLTALEVFSQLAGVELPAADSERWVLVSSGRLPLSAADHPLLGDAAARFPLLV